MCVLLVGGSSGIGLAAANHLLQIGHKVTIAGRSQSRLDEARKSSAGDISTVVLDAANPAQVRKAFAASVHSIILYWRLGVARERVPSRL
jgi:short-subunit dehydrogenase involved in D-alanine esterification of teichoic acids